MRIIKYIHQFCHKYASMKEIYCANVCSVTVCCQSILVRYRDDTKRGEIHAVRYSGKFYMEPQSHPCKRLQ